MTRSADKQDGSSAPGAADGREPAVRSGAGDAQLISLGRPRARRGAPLSSSATLREETAVGPELSLAHLDGQRASSEGSQDAPRPREFGHELYTLMNGCLGCHACASDCPLKRQAPELKPRFVQLYHQRRSYPLGDRLVGSLESAVKLAALMPRVSNAIVGTSWAQRALRRWAGLVDIPRLPVETLRSGLRQRGKRIRSPRALAQMGEAERERGVLLVQDVFTSFLEPRVLLGVFDLIKCLGFEPHVLPYRPNGKPLHLKGFDDRFRAVAAMNRALLTEAEALGMPLVGVDPAVTLTYRAGYGEDDPASGVRVLLLQEWLVQEEHRIRLCLGDEPGQRLRPQRHHQLLAHCSERNAVPPGDWERVFSFFHLDLDAVDAFCCRRTDERCAPPLASLAGKDGREVVPLATGYTCRAELARAGGVAPRHPALVLLEALTTGRPLP